MSIIAVEITKDKIKFAYDSQMTYQNEAYNQIAPKVFKVNGVIAGVIGNGKYNYYLRDFLENKEHLKIEKEIDVMKLMDNYAEINKDNKNALFSDEEIILISNYNKVFYVCPFHNSCFEIAEFEAIGAGSGYATGVYHYSKDLIASVKIACKLNIYCGEPVNLLEVNRIKA